MKSHRETCAGRHRPLSRRHALKSGLLWLAGTSLMAETGSADPIIDIHQHTGYGGRSDRQLLEHQRAMGVSHTILLPAGSKFGLAANCGRNDSVKAAAEAHPKEFSYFANELPNLPETRAEIVGYLKGGAIGIGEQKFDVDCDSPEMERIAEIAQEFEVPVLMHFQHETYNRSFQRLPRLLKKFPKVNFIGHAQTWWGNIDLKHNQKVLYPTGKVTPGGLTDKWLEEFPNLFADLSAGSGLNALNRDEEFTRGFLERHRRKLLFGSDCNDPFGRGPGCTGAQILSIVRRLAPNREAERRILFENARKLFRLPEQIG